MKTMTQVENFIRDLTSIVRPTDAIDAECVKQMMLSYARQQHAVYFRVDQNGTVRLVGEGIKELTGYSSQEIVEMNRSEFFQPGKPCYSQAAVGVKMETTSGSYCNRSGEMVQFFMKRRPLVKEDEGGGYEGLLQRFDLSQEKYLDSVKQLPLLLLSISGSILSGNRSGCKLISEWGFQPGDSISDLMQEQLLAAWLGACPLRFGTYIYQPLIDEGVVLFSTIPNQVLAAEQKVHFFEFHDSKILLPMMVSL
ncbi:MAG: hypothetical protein Q9M31_06965 [Mariprofundus sp.]|nr:hypothetical protein [Mariprofundus sp.]